MSEKHAVLRWTCLTCGWQHLVPMPGFPGNGYDHFDDGQTPCGPMIAVREPGFARADPGAQLEQPGD